MPGGGRQAVTASKARRRPLPGGLLPQHGQSLQSLPLLASRLTTVSVNEKLTESQRERKEERGEASRELGMCRDVASTSLSGIFSQPIRAAATSLTPANRPRRFQGRLRLEKEIPPHVCKHYPWPRFQGRPVAKRAHTPEPSITQAGLVSFNHFQALSLSRGGWVMDKFLSVL